MSNRIREEFRYRSLGFSYNLPHHFVVSQWHINQSKFLAWRTFWFLWHLAWLIRSIQYEISKQNYTLRSLKWCIYLTNWAYTILLLQSGVHLAVVARYTHEKKTKAEDFKDERAGRLMKLLWFLSNIAFDAAIIVTILYWTLVFKELKTAFTLMTHAANSLYVILDIFLVACPVRLLHFLYSCGVATAYLAFTVLYHLADGTNSDSEPYIYSSLDWSNPVGSSVLAASVILVAFPFVHLFQFTLHLLRLYIAESCYGSEEKSLEREDTEERKGAEGDAEMGRSSTEKY
ncbi:protein rolling stone-like [Plakobranchus ocellatus]|uniref:Protein rolling stone-like n=1 Tax=Plakobranchus ocellatus TaxID=259542 RepID=A0AAV4DIB7_9GAST|nr:protein rolling stone-like [Plakobranchus ocellatus]